MSLQSTRPKKNVYSAKHPRKQTIATSGNRVRRTGNSQQICFFLCMRTNGAQECPHSSGKRRVLGETRQVVLWSGFLPFPELLHPPSGQPGQEQERILQWKLPNETPEGSAPEFLEVVVCVDLEVLSGFRWVPCSYATHSKFLKCD